MKLTRREIIRTPRNEATLSNMSNIRVARGIISNIEFHSFEISGESPLECKGLIILPSICNVLKSLTNPKHRRMNDYKLIAKTTFSQFVVSNRIKIRSPATSEWQEARVSKKSSGCQLRVEQRTEKEDTKNVDKDSENDRSKREAFLLKLSNPVPSTALCRQ